VISEQQVLEAVQNDTVHQLQGIVDNENNISNPSTVLAEDSNGNEIQSVYVDKNESHHCHIGKHL